MKKRLVKVIICVSIISVVSQQIANCKSIVVANNKYESNIYTIDPPGEEDKKPVNK